MVRSLAAFESLLVVTLVACGGLASSPSADAGADGTASPPGASDAAIDTGVRDAAACLADEPTEGSACAPGQTVCSSGDPCCRGYVWSCDAATSTWRRFGLGCACVVDAGRTSVTCGTQTCAANEYCTTAGGGPRPLDGGNNTTYKCTQLPARCVATPTCACIHPEPSTGCSCADVGGHPAITCNYP